MGKATINLAKGYDPKKLNFPVLLSEKLDGVPVKITVHVPGTAGVYTYNVQTRQGEPVYSVSRQVKEFLRANDSLFSGAVGVHTFVAEVTQSRDRYAPFKDTSGIVRRQEQQENLTLNFFEYHWDAGDESYIDRFQFLAEKMQTSTEYCPVATYICRDQAEMERHFDAWMLHHPLCEGMVARSWDDTFVPNKRSWGYQKMLNEPTIDLRIVDVEEAVSKDGEPLGMAGRLVASYKGKRIGIGPGKLSHAERAKLWQDFKNAQTSSVGWHSPIAKIKYKKDASYDALRQPTFQHWHDKDEPDA